MLWKNFHGTKNHDQLFCATCANRAYKAEKKEKRLQTNSDEIKEHNRQKLLLQEFLSITNAAALLGVSRPTIYKMITNGTLKTIHISERIIRIKRTDLEQTHNAISPISMPIAEIRRTKEELISKKEAMQKFGISEAWLYKKTQVKSVQPTMIDGKAYYSPKVLQKLFAKQQYPEISEWYTVADIMEKFGVSKQYVYEYTSDHKMSKKRTARKS